MRKNEPGFTQKQVGFYIKTSQVFIENKPGFIRKPGWFYTKKNEGGALGLTLFCFVAYSLACGYALFMIHLIAFWYS